MQNVLWHSLDEQQVLDVLNTDRTGLTSSEAQERLVKYGKNEIPDSGRRHWIFLLVKQLQSMLVFILFIAAFISWITGHYIDMYVILAVIMINTLIGFIQEFRADKAIESLKTMVIPVAKVFRNSTKTTVDSRMLVPGDIIIIEEGDLVPADARLIHIRNLRMIESPLTGESVPVTKNTELADEKSGLADRRNMIYKGTFAAGGYAEAVVTTTGMQTALGEIAGSIKSIKKEKTNFQKKIDTLARQMGIIAIISATVLFIIGYIDKEAPAEELMLVSIAALVSAIPEGLPAVLAIVLAIGANHMAKRNAIIREFTATETLGAVTTIITDKTGTLTQNTLTVTKLATADGEIWDVTGDGWSPAGNFKKNGIISDIMDAPNARMLLTIGGWSNNSEIRHHTEDDSYHLVGDPTEGALLVLARKAGLKPGIGTGIKKLDDLPFNSELKMRATLVDQADRKMLLIIGAPEKILSNCTKTLDKSGEKAEFVSNSKDKIKNQINEWSSLAMRVIGLAYKEVPADTEKIFPEMLHDFCFAGLAGMIDPPRHDVRKSVLQCKQAGIRVIMATGDHINTAVAIGRATGIIPESEDYSPLALTEQQLENLDEKEFENAVSQVNIFARLTPNMKLKIADVLQKKGDLIAMTGDGVNDAPALKKADVGVAMGIAGTDVARDAAQVVLADDNFSTIVHAIEEGRIVFTNARQTSFFLITTNFAEIITLITSILTGLPIPLTATQLLWLNLVTDGVGDISLATERGHGDVLQQKPVSPKEGILNKEIIPFLFINAILMTVLTLTAFKYFLPISLEKARSAAFIMMAFTQLFNLFNMRSLKLSVFRIGMFSNKYINIALIVSLIIQICIIEIPFFEVLFKFDPISFSEFTILGMIASSVLWVGEIYKWIKYRMNKF
ncbi:MAG: HAD-IC family P-type ATPase [Saprospiraceae bacterium]|nr:HAD-IC family P-type ATPase [Saprospiraceae bacterium]